VIKMFPHHTVPSWEFEEGSPIGIMMPVRASCPGFEGGAA